MPVEIKVISLAGVNCYLVKTGGGCFLIDTGFSFRRRAIEKELKKASCQPGDLKLIIITHGDFDHTGNCAFFRKKYRARIAVHRDESRVVETGDMLAARRRQRRWRTRLLLGILRLAIFRTFRPDLYVEDGEDLSPFGFDARVIHLPGHSAGSIGVLTGEGDLFAGDLFINNGRPTLNTNMDDFQAGRASFQKLKKLEIRTVYPGHGQPFPIKVT